MAFILGSDQRLPVGTTVSVYPTTAFPGTSSSPAAPAVTSAVVAADGTTTFTGLAADTQFVAAAEVSGEWVHKGFRTPPLGDVEAIQVMTQVQYDALLETNPTTLYIIID